MLQNFHNDSSTTRSSKQLEQTSSHLIAQSLFNNSPVLFLESFHQVTTHPSEQTEQTEHTSSKVHTPPDNTHEIPPPPPPP